MSQCDEQELNLHIPKAAALQAVGLANAQPTHVVLEWRRRESNPQITKV